MNKWKRRWDIHANNISFTVNRAIFIRVFHLTFTTLWSLVLVSEKEAKVQRDLPADDLAASKLVFKLRSLTLKPIPYLPYHIVSPESHSVFFST